MPDWDNLPSRSRSSATIQRDARDETMAQMLMVDAFEAVTAGHAGSVKNFLKHKVSQGLSTMSTADRASSKGEVPMKTQLLSRDYIQEKAMTDIRGSGATVANLMTKLCTHFRNAATCMTELQGVGTAQVTTCKQAFGLASHVGELIHEMNKVNAYLLPVI